MAESTDTTIGEPVPERLQRGFSFRSALSLAFADVSPIAAANSPRVKMAYTAAIGDTSAKASDSAERKLNPR